MFNFPIRKAKAASNQLITQHYYQTCANCADPIIPRLWFWLFVSVHIQHVTKTMLFEWHQAQRKAYYYNFLPSLVIIRDVGIAIYRHIQLLESQKYTAIKLISIFIFIYDRNNIMCFFNNTKKSVCQKRRCNILNQNLH